MKYLKIALAAFLLTGCMEGGVKSASEVSRVAVLGGYPNFQRYFWVAVDSL
jgi:hypothetical protein